LSGRHLLPKVLKRWFVPTQVEEVIQPNYIKIDVKLNTLKYLREYVKNEYNGIKQFFLWWIGQKNEHDLNRFESVVSQ
jgi:hypothetical protein